MAEGVDGLEGSFSFRWDMVQQLIQRTKDSYSYLRY